MTHVSGFLLLAPPVTIFWLGEKFPQVHDVRSMSPLSDQKDLPMKNYSPHNPGFFQPLCGIIAI